MPKGKPSTKSPSKSDIDTDTTHKTPNSISKDNAAEPVTSTKKKAGIKRTRTMAQTAKEGKAYLKQNKMTKKRNASKSSSRSQSKDKKSPKKESPKKESPSKRSTSESKSASRSKSTKKDSKKEKSATRSPTKSKKSDSTDTSKEKTGGIKRTRTIADTIKNSESLIGDSASTGRGHRNKEQERDAEKNKDNESRGRSKSKGGKAGLKRKSTMAAAVEDSKTFIKGVKGRTRSKGSKRK